MSRDSLPIIEVDELPSKYLPYPKGTVVKYTPYTFGDIKKISQSKGSPATLFQTVLQGIETTGIDAKDLTLSDFLFVSLLRKLSSLGATQFTLTLPCAKCFTEVKQRFSSDALEFNDLDVPALPIVVELGGEELHFSPLTVGKFIMLVENNKIDDEVALLAAEVCNLPYEKALGAIENATGADMEVLSQIDSYTFHDVKPLECECSVCGHVTLQPLQGREDLIRPFRESGDAVRSRLRFGLQTEHSDSVG